MVIFVISSVITTLHAQDVVEIDSTIIKSDSNKLITTAYGDIDISGYIQPQYQVAQSAGIHSFAGGDFSEHSNNRFALRRARVKFDYLYDKPESGPIVFMAIQINATEKGVALRDMYGQILEPKWKKFSLLAGLFSRPFGFETNMSSSVRESPERTRMNQIILPSERDLGVMVTFNQPLLGKVIKGKLKFSAGIFNGGGLSSKTDFDNFKDVIARVQLISVRLSDKISMGLGFSGYYGSVRSDSKSIVYFSDGAIHLDESFHNIGKRVRRAYYGADFQIKRTYHNGATELRAEYIGGVQPGTGNSNYTAVPAAGEDIFKRRFAGGYVLFLQNIFSHRHQLIFKCDIYDPNLDFSTEKSQQNDLLYSIADHKYTTFGLGYSFYMNKHVKLVFYYDKIYNEYFKSLQEDIKDDVLTARMQFNF